MAIVVRGEAYGRTYDYECKIVSRTEKEAIFETNSEPRHIIKITPRYVGSNIGSHDLLVWSRGKNATVCALFFDEEYVALALFFENENGEIEINPCEH